MNKKLIIILITIVILSYTISCLVIYGIAGIKIITVEDYSLGYKMIIDNTKVYDSQGNYKYTQYFCIKNQNYNVGDKVLVIYHIEDEFNINELFTIKW